MQDHPLTPMTEPNLVRVLQGQTESKVCLVDHCGLGEGSAAVQAAFEAVQADGLRMAVVDAIDEQDLMTIGTAVNGMALVTGGSGIGVGLPNNFRLGGIAANHGVLRHEDWQAAPGSLLPTWRRRVG